MLVNFNEFTSQLSDFIKKLLYEIAELFPCHVIGIFRNIGENRTISLSHFINRVLYESSAIVK